MTQAPPVRIPAGFASLLLQGGTLLLRFVFMLVLLRESSSAVLGHYGLFTAIEVVTIYVAGFEFHAFATRRYARHPTAVQLRLCAASHRRMLAISAPLAAALAVGAALVLGLELPATQLAAFAIVVASGSVAQELARYLVLVGKPVHSVSVVFIRTAAWQPLVLPFIGTEEQTVQRMLYTWAAVAVLGTAWGLWLMRFALRSHTVPRTRYLLHGLRAARSYYVASGTSVLQGNLERFILQLFLGPASVGVFSFFQTLANTLPALIQSAILNIFLARLLGDFGQRLAGRIEYLRKVVRHSLLVSAGIALAIVAAAVPLVLLTGRHDYVRFIWILPLLLLGQVLMMWTQPIQLAFYGAHHDRILVWLALAALAASLMLNVALIGAIGLAGAVAAPLAVGAALAAARWRLLHVLQARGAL